MTLRERRVKFTYLLAKLVLWISMHPTWSVALDEAKVFQTRRGKDSTGIYRSFMDLVHRPASKHYQGLAADLNLYIDGTYITGAHPAWKEIGGFWKALDPECTWGGDFSNVTDLNHFSLGER